MLAYWPHPYLQYPWFLDILCISIHSLHWNFEHTPCGTTDCTSHTVPSQYHCLTIDTQGIAISTTWVQQSLVLNRSFLTTGNVVKCEFSIQGLRWSLISTWQYTNEQGFSPCSQLQEKYNMLMHRHHSQKNHLACLLQSQSLLASTKLLLLVQ